MEKEMSGEEDRRIRVMRDETPVRAVLKMGIPLVLGMLIMVLYNMVDTFYIGLLHDDYQLAAVSLAYPVMMIMIAVSNMVGTGGSSLIARSIGAGRMDRAEKTLLCGYELTGILSILIAFLGLVFLSPLIQLLGARDYTFAYTADYVRCLLIGCFAICGNYTFGQLLRAEGSVRYSVAGMLLGTLANIVLDPLFIFTFDLKVRGAAIATVLGNLAGAFCSVYFYLRGKSLLRMRREYLRMDLSLVREIFAVGVPASLETLLTASTYVVLNNLAVAYGELTLAAMGISQKLMSLGSYIYQGFAAGMSPLMGYNYGAKNYGRMRKILKAGILVTDAVELVVMAVFGLFAPALIGIFTESAEVIRIGSRVLRRNLFILPFVGAISSTRASFQAMGKPMYALGITLTRQIVLYIPLLMLLNHFFGFDGLITAQPLTEGIMMLLSILLLTSCLDRMEGKTEKFSSRA